jgi:hypothetical protein
MISTLIKGCIKGIEGKLAKEGLELSATKTVIHDLLKEETFKIKFLGYMLI